jgi:hypothetical protein
MLKTCCSSKTADTTCACSQQLKRRWRIRHDKVECWSSPSQSPVPVRTQHLFLSTSCSRTSSVGVRVFDMSRVGFLSTSCSRTSMDRLKVSRGTDDGGSFRYEVVVRLVYWLVQMQVSLQRSYSRSQVRSSSPARYSIQLLPSYRPVNPNLDAQSASSLSRSNGPRRRRAQLQLRQLRSCAAAAAAAVRALRQLQLLARRERWGSRARCAVEAAGVLQQLLLVSCDSCSCSRAATAAVRAPSPSSNSCCSCAVAEQQLLQREQQIVLLLV